jgi:pheromone shutdown-related protein TraB
MTAIAMDSLTHLEYEGRDIYLLGTAHVSQRSVDDVGRVIEDLRPDTVCVELDATRHQALVDPKRWRNLDIFQVIRERRILFLASSLVLSSYQRRLGEKLGVRPGAEMLAAVQHAERVGARLVLADRDIRATLQRTWAELSAWDCIQLLITLVGSMFAKGEITSEQVEALKDRDTITELVREFAEVMPRLQRPLIDERDRFLMSAIRDAPGRTVLAVVGAGHVEGMTRYLHAEVDRDALSQIPAPSWRKRLLPWLVPVLAGLGFYRAHASDQGVGLGQSLLTFALANSLVVVAFSLLARPKVLTALGVALASPVCALVPHLQSGTLGAYMEASLRRPSALDCEALSQVATRADWYDNRFTRVLLVGFFVTLGSVAGALVALLCVWLLG